MSNGIFIPHNYLRWTPPPSEGRPRGGSVPLSICKHRTAPPCLGEALRRGALIELHGLMIFTIRVWTPVHVCFRWKNAQFQQFREVLIPLLRWPAPHQNGTPPRRFNDLKTPPRPLKSLLQMHFISQQFFMVRGRTIPIHARFWYKKN